MGHTWLNRDLDKQQKQSIAEAYSAGESMESIRQRFSCSRRTIRAILSDLGVSIRTSPSSFLLGKANARKHKLNESFFDKIDNEASAYFLGLLCADGWVSGRPGEIGLSLADPEPVHAFRDALDYSGAVVPRKPSGYGKLSIYELRFRSLYMWRHLRKLGVDHNKTETLAASLLVHIDSECLHHFVRGFMDGDGGCRYKGTRRDGCVYFCGTKSILSALSSLLNQRLGVSNIEPRAQGSKLWVIEWAGNKQFKLLRGWLYENANLYLKRKKDKFYA
jgi:hypothetical protein